MVDLLEQRGARGRVDDAQAGGVDVERLGRRRSVEVQALQRRELPAGLAAEGGQRQRLLQGDGALAARRSQAGSVTVVGLAELANRALHLQLDQPVHLDGVLHRQLLDDRLDEAVDDELARLLLGQAVAT